MPTTAELLADALHTAGIDIVFGMPGGEVVAVLEAIRQRGIRFELMHHESSAVFAADGYARATGGIGCVLTTLGPGATNAAAGMAHAWLDRAPVVLITAQKPEDLLPDYTHQVVDLQAIFAPITKATVKVTAENAASALPDAIALTRQGRPGPVHLQLSNEEAVKVAGGAPFHSPFTIHHSPFAISSFSPFLSAKRPVILAGLGLEPEAPYAALQELAEAAHAPVIVLPKAKGALPDDHPLSAGSLGLTRTDPVYEILDEADCVLAVGFDVVELVKKWQHPAPLLWIAN
nr:thiamine pyrophosphate-binding protein [Caldilineaceae bacterium]